MKCCKKEKKNKQKLKGVVRGAGALEEVCLSGIASHLSLTTTNI